MNAKINRIAEVLNLKIEQGKINLTVKLKGETEPMDISFNYVIQDDVICVSEVKTNKEWINGLVDIFKEKYSKIDLKDISKNETVKKIIKYFL
ncbi:MAG: hypothetical protein LBQ76_09925 [Candidatus Fibromonas sp.]|jgi:hypothetical protein|nr:hypothetical protein [Candidatus Fibromonas sp.]